jgi:hypothetical protein
MKIFLGLTILEKCVLGKFEPTGKKSRRPQPSFGSEAVRAR